MPQGGDGCGAPAHQPDDLARLRARLDEIDKQFLDVVRARLDCCVAIAQAKQAHDIPMMQPHRIGVVQQRGARFAAEHGIDPDFVRRLYDLVIAETCRIETLVIDHGAVTPRVPHTHEGRAATCERF